jgi:hypothetical protein
MYSVEDQQADREERMRDPMSASSGVDLIGNDTMEQKTYSITMNGDKEQEVSNRLFTCNPDDLDEALETNHLEDETAEVQAVVDGEEEVINNNPMKEVDVKNNVNMTVCTNFKAYQRELPGDWPAIVDGASDEPEDGTKKVDVTNCVSI